MKGVRGGSGLEGASAQEGRPCGFYTLGNLADLGLCLNRTWTSNQRKAAVADLLPGGEGDDRVVGMKFPVGLLVRFLHALYAFDKILCRNVVDIDGCGVTEQAEHGTLCADPSIDFDIVFFGEIIREMFDLLVCAVWFQYNNHVDTLQNLNVRLWGK